MTLLLNIGGIQKIEITNAENVTLGTPNTNNEVSVSNSGTWEELPATIESASFTETEKQVEEGVVFESELKFKIPKVSVSNHLLAHKYSNVEVVARITDNNGQVIIMGESSNPVFLLNKKTIPRKTADLNRYDFTIKHQSAHPVYFSA